MSRRLRIATRRSALALWQARHVRDLLEARSGDLTVELVPMVTRGDRVLDQPLAEIGGKGLFLKELEEALLDGRADLAVHSLKDVPAEMADGLCLEAVLPRANPHDALLSRSGAGLDRLPAGSRVGTSSLRRQCQLLNLRPDLQVESLRGNVDTRLRKLQEDRYDAIILACAGLERLGLQENVTEVLEPPAWLPAATQGIIGLQCRADDAHTRGWLAPLGDARAAIQARAERAVARLLEGSCQVPLAAYARIHDETARLSALVGTPDGRRIIRAEDTGPTADVEKLAHAVADSLFEQGAREIIASLPGR